MTAAPATSAPQAAAAALLEADDIWKAFGQTSVLKGVSLSIRPGEVLALMGANGAGKSTLMNILAGVLQPDRGVTRWDGEPLSLSGPADAHRAGIAMVHQELHLAPEMTVAENIFLGSEPLTRWGTIDRARMNAAAEALLRRLSCPRAPTAKVGDLRVAEQQLVEIAKALSREARLLILDEPTAALSEREVADLLDVVRGLQREGVAVIYTSHRMEEVFGIASHVLVMRDGAAVRWSRAEETGREALIRDMVGRDVAEFDRQARVHGEVVLGAHGLRRVRADGTVLIDGVPLEARAGEVLGIGGLMGAGRTELLELLAGASDDPWSGEILLEGRPYRPRSPADGIGRGVAFITEDRKGSGLILHESIAFNMSLASLPELSSLGWLRKRDQRSLVDGFMRSLAVKATGPDQPAASLSGGNQQKVVIGKWLATAPRLLLLDEPTRGVDVGAKAAFYELIDSLTAEGLAVILVSSDWMELMQLSDRILVLQGGRPAALLEPDQFSQERLLDHAMPGGPIEPRFQDAGESAR